MEFSLSKHALVVMSERGIDELYLRKTLEHPELILDDSIDRELQHRLKAIPEYGNRVLRVIVNNSKSPIHVVTAYFDRSMRGKL
jgi:hypothetical protein